MVQDATWRSEAQSAGRTTPRRATVVSTASTHQGLRRTSNQDGFLERADIALWAVADGVGGLKAGEKASGAVIDAMSEIKSNDNLVESVLRSLHQANNNLRLEALIGEHGMAATTVVVFITDRARRNFTCLWVGDSRLYRLRGKVFEQITKDHTPPIRFSDPSCPDLRKVSTNALSRAIGSDEDLDVDQITGTIKPGDVFLLCTDGLSKPVDPGTISRLLATSKVAAASDRLVEAALDAGGPDNVTAVVVGFPGRSRLKNKIGTAKQGNTAATARGWLFKYIPISIGIVTLLLSIWTTLAQRSLHAAELFQHVLTASLALLTLIVAIETVPSSELRRMLRAPAVVIAASIVSFVALQWASMNELSLFPTFQALTRLLNP
ncbi:PP2C family protein-serine/threonine phosphatase [Pararhizobium arenae]|uniref:PP2C family protein-serine/threonine phosphatase n=1 Tax=Pararhizobium arenae TaxID=1856850 RepID=UPI00094B395F|nr:protein phosphatase 2C domain-containing protein [Pararhizobium arenae]